MNSFLSASEHPIQLSGRRRVVRDAAADLTSCRCQVTQADFHDFIGLRPTRQPLDS